MATKTPAADFYILTVTTYTTIAVVGTAGNALTLYVALRDKKLRSSIGSILGLVQALACNDLVASSVGLSIYIWNIVAGAAWPFTTPWVCTTSNLLFLNLVRSSLWYLFALALTRLSAVVTPVAHRRLMEMKAVRWAMVAVPFLMGTAPKTIALLMRWVAIKAHPVTGACQTKPIDASDEAYANTRVSRIFALNFPPLY